MMELFDLNIRGDSLKKCDAIKSFVKVVEILEILLLMISFIHYNELQ